MDKCEDMIMAFAAKNLKPDLNCILGTRYAAVHRAMYSTSDLTALTSLQFCATSHWGNNNYSFVYLPIFCFSTRDCMNKIQMGDADMITLDAADVHVAGR